MPLSDSVTSGRGPGANLEPPQATRKAGKELGRNGGWGEGTAVKDRAEASSQERGAKTWGTVRSHHHSHGALDSLSDTRSALLRTPHTPPFRTAPHPAGWSLHFVQCPPRKKAEGRAVMLIKHLLCARPLTQGRQQGRGRGKMQTPIYLSLRQDSFHYGL